ncbi:hypothetical protein [Cerasicoccus maritimus]|uniref:hypothetical protein n=1 Tax=Cerasicoccus maritimus TaxID=490089 RepID=UPI002852B2EA|nr:hypothetical protein [Cerasicoccus maritimus]
MITYLKWGLRAALLLAFVGIFWFTRVAEANFRDSCIIFVAFGIPVLGIYAFADIKIRSKLDHVPLVSGGTLQQMHLEPGGMSVKRSLPGINPVDFTIFYFVQGLLCSLNRDGLIANIVMHPFTYWRGKRTWGCIVKANSELYNYGIGSMPAFIIYSDTPDGTADLNELEYAADIVSQAHYDGSPEMAQLAQVVHDDYSRDRGVTVPAEFGLRYPYRVSSFFVRRGFLPDRRITQNILPVRVGQSGVVTILHYKHWTKAMRAYWRGKTTTQTGMRSLEELAQ